MTIAALLKAGLAADSGVSALASGRIYPLVFGSNNPTLPAITYQRISSTGQDGTSNRKEERWQINCWGGTHVAAVSLSAVVKIFIEEWHDSDQTPGISWARVVNELDDYDDEAKVFRNIVDVILHTLGD